MNLDTINPTEINNVYARLSNGQLLSARMDEVANPQFKAHRFKMFKRTVEKHYTDYKVFTD